ncbi:MAG: hypothetical protein WA633_20695 [Stellaceae bacterium]
MKAGSPKRARALVEITLSHADDLGLDHSQIAALNRLYWPAQAGPPKPDVVSEVIALLSPEQLRVAMGHFITSTRLSPTVGGLDPEMVDAMVASALEKQTKEKAVVEVELATKVADRLLTWSKAFGLFVAAPVALLLLILCLFGISKLEDARKAADRADQLLNRADKVLMQVESRSTALETTGNKLFEQIERVKQLAQEDEGKLGELTKRQKSTERSVQELRNGLSVRSEAGNREPGSSPPDPEIGITPPGG